MNDTEYTKKLKEPSVSRDPAQKQRLVVLSSPKEIGPAWWGHRPPQLV